MKFFLNDVETISEPLENHQQELSIESQFVSFFKSVITKKFLSENCFGWEIQFALKFFSI